MIFEIQKTFRFEAGHSLVHHDGKCRNPHGHSYVLTLHVARNELIPSGPKSNMVCDFGDLSKIVKPMINKYFDHQWVNDTLKSDSPTVEFMSKWIYDYLKKDLPYLVAVTLHETETSRVTYRP